MVALVAEHIYAVCSDNTVRRLHAEAGELTELAQLDSAAWLSLDADETRIIAGATGGVVAQLTPSGERLADIQTPLRSPYSSRDYSKINLRKAGRTIKPST